VQTCLALVVGSEKLGPNPESVWVSPADSVPLGRAAAAKLLTLLLTQVPSRGIRAPGNSQFSLLYQGFYGGGPLETRTPDPLIKSCSGYCPPVFTE
jgi:hypothetical protein